MQIKYCCTYWGCEKDSPDAFVRKVLAAGYTGIEIFLPPQTDSFTKRFVEIWEGMRDQNTDFVFIAQQLTAPSNESVDAYIARMTQSYYELAAYQPSFINAHTGKDFYSFADNCKVIEAALNIGSKTGIRILHETHRGRFSYHAASLLPYLKAFPELELVGDFSHFCAVSESLLEDQQDILQQIIPHVAHIHARVGHAQAAQVNDPFAPEWQHHLSVFEGWWQQILEEKQRTGIQKMTITPEFGPAPYMPLLPFTQQPLGNQWEINRKMMERLQSTLHL
ncbi:MAG: sugar phosphate isomerase/epimerase [Bacteroidetes bacterium]|nr:sugar phosphate isomerase/epimerase [Bacteroidota bacterium]